MNRIIKIGMDDETRDVIRFLYITGAKGNLSDQHAGGI